MRSWPTGYHFSLPSCLPFFRGTFPLEVLQMNRTNFKAIRLVRSVPQTRRLRFSFRPLLGCFSRRLLIILACCSFPICVAGQQAPQRDLQALAILQKAFSVLSRPTTINDVTLTGTATRIAGSDNEQGTAVLKATAIGQSLIGLTFPSGQRSEVRDTTAAPPAGAWSGPNAVSHPIAVHNLWSDPTWFFPVFLIARVISNPQYGVSYVGRENYGGATAEHLVVWEQPSSDAQTAAIIQRLSQTDLYLDSSSLLPIAVRFAIHPDGDEGLDIPAEVRFSNYGTVVSARVPFHVQKYIQNGLVLDIGIETVTTNSGLSSTTFTIQ